MSRIALSEPLLTGNVQRYLDECVATNFVSSVGPFVERFEAEFAAFVGARFAVACASGTAALHVALRMLDLQPGDEVLVPTLTFVASVNPIAYERATPVLVDSELETWNLDPALVVDYIERAARAGRKLPRAVEVVPLLGHPARLEPIMDVCAAHGITVIEDAAKHSARAIAPGAMRQAGRDDGRLGCFSFNGNKIITTGGGGIITTDDPELARRAKHLTTQARLPGLAYRHDEIGFNYRLTNLAAAVGVAHLEQLPAFMARKLEIAGALRRRVHRPSRCALPRAAWAAPTCWLYSPRAGTARDAWIAMLAAETIEARPIWTPVHHMPMFATHRASEAPTPSDSRPRRLAYRARSGSSRRIQERVISVLGR